MIMMTDHEIKQPRGKRKRYSKTILVILSFALVLLAAEALFGVLEIIVGRFLLFTNPIRPQIGRLWDEDHKEQLGINELEANSKSENLPTIVAIHSFEELKLVLSTRSSLSMSRDEFKKFYTDLPMLQAKRLLDPLYFIELDRNPEWQRTQLSLVGDQLVIYFIDGYERPIQESHVTVLDTLINVDYENTNAHQLDELEEFEGRSIPAAIFFRGFDRLPRTYRLQIVNDPYKLVQWGNNLQRVAISPFVTEEGVEIMFEIKGENGLYLENMFASEIAVNYLIDEFNSMDQEHQMEMPIEKYEND